MSAADTGERVLKVLADVLDTEVLLVYSCPPSSSHHALVSGLGFRVV
jgi:hypothetical protein